MSDAISQMREQIRKLQDDKARLSGDLEALAKKRPELDKQIMAAQAKLRDAKGPIVQQLQNEIRNAKEAAQGAAGGMQSLRGKIAELTGKIAELDKNIKIVEDFMRPKK